MKTAIFVQARMGSERLPGKVLLQVAGKPLLEYLVERLKKVTEADLVVVLTTKEQRDDCIEAICKEFYIPCFRGSEHDVLDRYYKAAKEYNVDTIVRITADCPLLDPKIIDKVIAYYKNHHNSYDYVSNTLERTSPRGMDVEVFSLQALEKAHKETKKEEEREHVTLYFYRHPELFRIYGIKDAKDLSHLRLTVDTPEDFTLVKTLLEELYPHNKKFSLNDILALFQRKPQLIEINAHINQKKI